MGFTLAAVVGIYQVTQRSTYFAVAGEDAQMSARALVDRIAVDLRLVNAGRPMAGAPAGFITAATATAVAFRGDAETDTLDASRNDARLSAAASAGATSVALTSASGFSVGEMLYIADGTIEENQAITGVSGTTLTLAAGLGTWYPVETTIVRSVETVTWAWDAGSGTVCRRVNAACTAPFPADAIVAAGVTGFQVTYFDAGGTAIAPGSLGTQAARDTIRRIGVAATVRLGRGDQQVSRRMEIEIRPRSL
jgi:hypothetical protein